MVKRNYNYTIANEKKIAKAFVSNARISAKYSTEFCRELKGKRVDKAEKFLRDVLEQKRFLPLRLYNKKVGHRKGVAQSFVKSGRFPERTCRVFLDLLNSVKANADYKGLNAENLIIEHLFASRGWRRLGHQAQGRIAGKRHRQKSTHLEVIVREAK